MLRRRYRRVAGRCDTAECGNVPSSPEAGASRRAAALRTARANWPDADQDRIGSASDHSSRPWRVFLEQRRPGQRSCPVQALAGDDGCQGGRSAVEGSHSAPAACIGATARGYLAAQSGTPFGTATDFLGNVGALALASGVRPGRLPMSGSRQNSGDGRGGLRQAERGNTGRGHLGLTPSNGALTRPTAWSQRCCCGRLWCVEEWCDWILRSGADITASARLLRCASCFVPRWLGESGRSRPSKARSTRLGLAEAAWFCCRVRRESARRVLRANWWHRRVTEAALCSSAERWIRARHPPSVP